MGQDSLPSEYGVEMYPGKSIWAWGVLALGAGALLVSGLQWTESAIRPESGGSARSIPLGESESDSASVSERSTKEDTTDEIIFKPQEIGGDRRWKRSTRLDSCDDGSMIEETSVIYEKQRVLPSIDVDDDELSRRNLHVNESGSTLDESSERDQHPVIIGTDAHLNTETRASDENKPGRLAERERLRYKKGSDRAMIDVVTSPTLRNDRFKKDIVVDTGSRSKSKDQWGLRIDVVGRNAEAPRSRQANINVDNYLRSSTLMPRHIRNSKRIGNHRVSKIDVSTSKSGDRKGILEMRERNGRLGDQHKSLDPHTSRITGAIMEIKEEIAPALSRSIINDRDIETLREAGECETSRSSSGKQATALGSLERNPAEGDARQFAAGMQEDQLLFFRGDRERVQSSAVSPAEATHDRKNWPGERDRGDSARKRRETSRDWLARTLNRSRNFRGRYNDIYRDEKSIINSNERNDKNNEHNDRETDFHKNDKSQDIFSKGLSSVDSELRDESNDEWSSDDTNAFQFLDSIIPPDNKRRRVTRGEDLKDLMVTSNFVWTSQDQEIRNRALVSEHRPTFSQDSRKTLRNGSAKKRIRSADRRRDARGHRGRTGETGSAAVQRADRREETANGDRRKRYANYYSAQSATPMAYVHIQPAYPATPPTNRKCLQCMVVYKRPCPSQSRPPPRIVLPSYRYHEPATKWRGLKYGEWRCLLRMFLSRQCP